MKQSKNLKRRKAKAKVTNRVIEDRWREGIKTGRHGGKRK